MSSSTLSFNRTNNNNGTGIGNHQHHHRPKFTEKVENYYRSSENVYKLGPTTDYYQWNTNNHVNDFFLNFGPKSNELYELNIDVPGYRAEDINITTKDNLLIVSGRQEAEQQSNKNEPYYSLNFTNKYRLPDNVDKNNMSCVFKDRSSRLTIKAPILKPSTPNCRTIPIKIIDSESNNNNNNPDTTTTATIIINKPTMANSGNSKSNSNASIFTGNSNNSGSNVSHV